MLFSGKNVAKTILEKKLKVNKIYLWEDFSDKNFDLAYLKQNFNTKIVSKKQLDQLAPGNHQGIIIDIDLDFNLTLEDIINQNKELIVMLDHLEDPHNVGAIIRTCTLAGVDAIIIPKQRSVTINNTVMKTSAGTLVKAPICLVSNLRDAILKLKKAGFWIIGSDSSGTPYDEIDYKGKIVIIIGNEGAGMSNIITKECDFMATIPTYHAESLNASVAAGIIIYEAKKQRK